MYDITSFSRSWPFCWCS